MDMNFCQSLEILCLNFLKAVEFESEGERDQGKGEKKEQTKRKCLSCLQTWEMPLSALCCLGVMQITSGCLSRLNRDRNRQWSKHYKAGWRSAATEKTDNTQRNVCLVHSWVVWSHIYKGKKHRHSAILNKCYSQPTTLCNYTQIC